MDEDYVFECKKCGHVVYASSTDKMLSYDCPECGEEWFKNWIFIGKGDFKKDCGEQETETDSGDETPGQD